MNWEYVQLSLNTIAFIDRKDNTMIKYLINLFKPKKLNELTEEEFLKGL